MNGAKNKAPLVIKPNLEEEEEGFVDYSEGNGSLGSIRGSIRSQRSGSVKSNGSNQVSDQVRLRLMNAI